MGNNMDLDYEMFCYQCEQTANGKGCTVSVSAERHRKLPIFRIFLSIRSKASAAMEKFSQSLDIQLRKQ